MTVAGVSTVLENDRVIVRRIRHSGPGPVSSARRAERLVIYLKDSRIRRTEGGQHEDISHQAGDVVWQPGSEHDIEHLEGGEHDVLIVEFKA